MAKEIHYDANLPKEDRVDLALKKMVDTKDTLFPDRMFAIMSNGGECFVSINADGDEMRDMFYSAAKNYPLIMAKAAVGILTALNKPQNNESNI